MYCTIVTNTMSKTAHAGHDVTECIAQYEAQLPIVDIRATDAHSACCGENRTLVVFRNTSTNPDKR
jgi:hypothetical protein